MSNVYNFIKIYILSLILTLSACSNSSDYSGDGEFIDNGPFEANYRYILDLGNIDVSQKGDYVYELGNLPEEKFGISFVLVFVENTKNIYHSDLVVGLTLVSESEGDVIKIENSDITDEWIWSYGVGRNYKKFVYHNKHHFFLPKADTKYILKLKIVSPDATGSISESKLILRAQGWK